MQHSKVMCCGYGMSNRFSADCMCRNAAGFQHAGFLHAVFQLATQVLFAAKTVGDFQLIDEVRCLQECRARIPTCGV